MAQHTYISEADFLRNESRRLNQLARDLRGVMEQLDTSARTVALECHIDPRIVRRVLHGVRVSGDCEARVRLWMERNRRDASSAT